MPYQTSRSRRSRLNNLLATQRPRRRATVQPGSLYRVCQVGGSVMGTMVRAESAEAAVAQFHALYPYTVGRALTVSPIV